MLEGVDGAVEDEVRFLVTSEVSSDGLGLDGAMPSVGEDKGRSRP